MEHSEIDHIDHNVSLNIVKRTKIIKYTVQTTMELNQKTGINRNLKFSNSWKLNNAWFLNNPGATEESISKIQNIGSK